MKFNRLTRRSSLLIDVVVSGVLLAASVVALELSHYTLAWALLLGFCWFFSSALFVAFDYCVKRWFSSR